MKTESNFIINFLREENSKLRQQSREEFRKKQRDFYNELFKNQATVLTVYRCIDQYSQELIQKMVRLSFHTNLDPNKQETILKRLLDENYPYQEFTKGQSHLAEFDLVNFKEKTINYGFMNAYLDIVTCGLKTEIDFCKQKKNNMKDYSQLEGKAKNQWKSICNQLMLMAQEINNTSSQSQSKYSRLVMDVFRQILSVEPGNLGSGYQKYMEFILEDTNTQIDKILTLYCYQYSRNHKISVETAVSFLLTLSNLDITKIYQNTYNNETATFQPRELEFLNDLHSLGMVFKKEILKDRIAFYITPVLWQFCYRKIDLKTLNAKITIETNFNVYAYIDQEDPKEIKDSKDTLKDQTEHIEKLLASFCDLHYKFPHLIVGQLSEQKTKDQFKNGLTARLLIQFFNKTSDPQMKKYLKDKQMNAILLTQVQNLQKKKLEFLNLFKKTEDNFSLIPDNIQQEIETWEREKNYQIRRDDNYNSDEDVKDKD
ncbi:transcription factor Tfb2 (macronuclear) [Tetrahymena thermophila SB210]|uniref:General transcription factor IIH subunit 4 n=1 Tax=Tetrahymena thermophila (strain SB210) TaxID=312017 RepID=Q22KF2_TETTS|nr:transcription factor Tfb2 [Tetrahymena thermophila SB210]EAR85847.2 transcription factor Tfb2 [Tetrahymena thermophila SB210]|eukprot:XP_001033510.2 transcription factor Tfb2 [Tetrahymena thermophila SB210]